MKPTTRFRWLIRQNPHPRAFEVLAHRDYYGTSIETAKRVLLAREVPVLQQWHEAEGWEPDDVVKTGGEWRDVETEIELLGPQS